jgi:S-DNA-T family DNA segregation ATPase FtsK/SpoIIIE
MDYKLIIFGNNIYREIELSEDMKDGILIGTTPVCEVRFNREYFFDDFELSVEKKEAWTLSCRPNIYFKIGSMLKQYLVVLKHGDSILINYDSTDSELFHVEFLIDYDRNPTPFEYCIDRSGQDRVMIGGSSQCQIRLLDSMIGEDFICLDCYAGNYHMEASNSRYGVYVNGFKVNQTSFDIREGDFFAIIGHQFYLSEGCLYVTEQQYIQTAFRMYKINQNSNALKYPRFIRNARQKYSLPKDTIEVLAPKSQTAEPKKNLIVTLIPALSSLVLMVALRGIMGGGGMFVLYSAGTMAVGAGMSVWTYFHDKKEYKEKKKEREEKYQAYLEVQERKIQNLREKEESILRMNYLSTEEDVSLVNDFGSRLFERSMQDEDFLEVYLGSGKVKSICQVKYKPQEYKDTEDELLDYPQYLHDKYEYMEQAPVTVNLKRNSAVGVVGVRSKLYQILKNMVLDLTARQFYLEVKLYFIFAKSDVSQFQWMRWFRHAYDERTDSRCFMYDEESSKFVLELLYSELSRREGMNKEQRQELAHYVIFVYRSQELVLHPAAKYIGRAKEYGFTFVFFEEHRELLHYGCEEVIFLEERAWQGWLVKSADGEKQQMFTYQHISGETAEACAKKLACVYVDEVSLEGSLTKNISLYELLHIMNVNDIDLRKRWAKSKIYDSMAAPLGVKSGNEVVYLDLHEKYHGPHGLVAGTTGSGKSEILQSYILSMATLFHPYEVGFVIIDFKGGGMVNQFRDLPHLNGAITNIDGREIERSLLSIRAELQKRQEIFAKYGVNHIDAYIRKFKSKEAEKPLPHLILIVDEFAELKSDQPEFMKELISTARIGRSLGVHLILATQKPSGVVDNQIWSNSKFKLCLKVQNKEDSTEVLKSPLAAEIKEPGRAYLQVGNNEIFQLFQSAYSGASSSRDNAGNEKSYKISKISLSGQRQVIFEQKNRENDDGETQLEAIVKYIHQYCEKNHIERLPNICLPPLAEVIPYPESLIEKKTDIVVPVGIYDDPNHQLQEELYVDFTQDNIFILGSSQYGKTNMLQVMIKAIALNYKPSEVHIYMIDFASMILKNFETLAHVGGVITPSDDEKLKTFMKMAMSEIKERKEILLKLGISSFSAYREGGFDQMPQIVLMIDHMTALKELYPQYEDTLLNICREGLSVGISVVAANLQTAGIGYKYFSNFSKRFSLYCNDSAEYGYLFDHCRVKPKNIPGRGITEIDKNIFDLQIYQAFSAEKEVERTAAIQKLIQEVNRRNVGVTAKRIPEIPKILTDTYIRDHFTGHARMPYEVLLGINFSNTELETLRMEKQGVLGISGRPHGGKTNFVNYILNTLIGNAVQEPVEIHILDRIDKKFISFCECPCVQTYSMEAQEVKQIILNMDRELEKRYHLMAEGKEAALEKEALLVLVLQNTDTMTVISTDQAVLDAYKRMTTKYKALKVCIMITDIENVNIGFGSPEVLKLLRDNKNLVVFENLGEQKLYDVPLAYMKEYVKPLEAGEAYRIVGNSLTKVKTVLKQ